MANEHTRIQAKAMPKGQFPIHLRELKRGKKHANTQSHAFLSQWHVDDRVLLCPQPLLALPLRRWAPTYTAHVTHSSSHGWQHNDFHHGAHSSGKITQKPLESTPVSVMFYFVNLLCGITAEKKNESKGNSGITYISSRRGWFLFPSGSPFGAPFPSVFENWDASPACSMESDLEGATQAFKALMLRKKE